MKACPTCDPSGVKVSLFRAYTPILANGIAFYPNPQTPSSSVMTVGELRRAFCASCARELGLLG